MPLRSDPSLWFNIPGVVAAYQPVRAPDALNARYNMAHGGDNRYRAEPGVLPTWKSTTGWSTTYAGTTYLNTNIVPGAGWSMLSRYVNHAYESHQYMTCGSLDASYRGIALMIDNYSANRSYWNRAQANVSATPPSSGVMGVAGQSGYFNGTYETAIGTNSPTWLPIWLGACNLNGSRAYGLQGDLLAVAIYGRVLSATEMWLASRQMAYCDVNPDWSVWGRRRRYYYAPSAATFNPAWAQRTNHLVGGGN